MSNKIPIYRGQLGQEDETGIFAISFVDYPANESNFVALKNIPRVKVSLNKKKQILTGAVLIPNQRIYRNDTQLGEYFLTFTAQDIENIAAKMMRKGLALSSTTHQHEAPLEGNFLTELWIVEDPKTDKSAALGLGEFPKGTLMASYKITDAKYWRDEVLTGNVKGFSLEGFFNFNSITMSKKTTTASTALAKKKANPIVALFKSIVVALEGETAADAEAIVEEAGKDETDSGEPVLIFPLADGGEIWVDAEGFATLDGEQMAPGEHALADGNVIVIDENGTLVVTQEEGEGEEPEVAEAALAAARAKGKAFLKAAGDPNKAKIAKLEAQLAELKKKPSTAQAKPKAAASVNLSKTQTIAAVLQAKNARRKG